MTLVSCQCGFVASSTDIHTPILVPSDDWKRFYVSCECGWQSRRSTAKPRKAYADHLRTLGLNDAAGKVTG